MEIKGIDWNLEGYKKEAHFFLCGAFESFDFIQDFIRKTKEYPCLLKDNTIIDSVYGSPTCIWNGGRILDNVFYNKKQLQNIHDIYADLGIKVRFVFTNSLLNEHDLHDRYCNLIMNIFKDVFPEIVVKSPMLEDYLRNKYPTASFISSTTKRLRSSKDQLKEFEKDYKYVCLDYDYNHDANFFNDIPETDRDRVEILVNPECPKNCTARNLHHQLNCKQQIEYGGIEEDYLQFECPLVKRTFDIPFSERGTTREYLTATNYIFPQDLDWYLDKGFNHFKLQDRTLPPKALFAVVFPYLVRPEFYQKIITMLNWQ